MEKKVIEIDIKSTGNGLDELEKKSQSAKARLKELKAEMLTLDEGDVRFQALSKEAGKLADDIADVNQRVKNIGSDTRGIDTVIEGVQGVTGAFAIGQGAIGLFGDSNDALEKSLLKVQSAMALVQGVQQVSTLLQKESNLMMAIGEARTKASAVASVAWATTQGVLNGSIGIGTVVMKAFNAVVAMNPIFLLVTAITAAVGAFALFGSSEETAAERADALNEKLDYQVKQFDRLVAARKQEGENALRLMKLQGASEEELFKQSQKNRDTDIAGERVKIEARKLAYNEQLALYRKAIAEEDEETAKATRDKLKALKSEIADMSAIRKQAMIEKRFEQLEERNRLKEEEEKKTEEEKAAQEKRNENYRKAMEERRAIMQKIEDINNSLIQDEFARKEAEENTRYKRELANAKGQKSLIEALEKEHSKNLAIISEERAKKWQDDIDKKIADEAKKRQEENEKEKQEKQLQIDNLNGIALNADAEYNALNESLLTERDIRLQERQQKIADWEALSDEEREKRKLDAATGTLTAINSLVELFAGKSRAQQERAFKVQKGVATAQALIDTYKAATSAYQSMAGIPYVGPVLGGIAAAGAVAAGIINVKKIQSQKFDGGGSSSGGSAPSVSSSLSGATGGAPSFTLAGASGVNQLANTVQNEKPVKAYVVGNDVTTAQSLERNKIENATL